MRQVLFWVSVPLLMTVAVFCMLLVMLANALSWIAMKVSFRLHQYTGWLVPKRLHPEKTKPEGPDNLAV